MPRPVKCRKVCHFPNVLEFLPADDTEKKMPIVLTVDEYETIRLLDKKGYSQEQCAESMQIARTTVQRIYEIARKKIADALIDGHPAKKSGVDKLSFRSDAGVFTEEQVKKETARCLGCGATIVDENQCVGCGICTTKCEFDAIHLQRDLPECSTMRRSEDKLKYILPYGAKQAIKIKFKKKKD